MAAKGSKYEGFIKEAILALKERTGSSLPAIKKHIAANHKDELKGNWESQLSQSLKRLAKSGKLIRVSLKLGCQFNPFQNLPSGLTLVLNSPFSLEQASCRFAALSRLSCSSKCLSSPEGLCY